MKTILKAIVAIAIFIGLMVYFFGGGMNAHVNDQMQTIQNQVAVDAEAQYDIAKRQGDPTQCYVQAGLVAAAYLQAKDEANYNKWKAIEQEEAKRAGVDF